MSSRQPYNRVVLKLSGECFASSELLTSVTDQLIQARKKTVALAVVVGGGNILRGRDTGDMDRTLADRAGMLATVINGIRLTELLSRRTTACHLSARAIPGFVEGFTTEKGRQELAEGNILVLSGGTGNPFFSTDSGAALRAAELQAEAILKGTNVAGIYSADPNKNSKARLYRRISFEKVLADRLGVMDMTAFALCMARRIPIHVFDIARPGAILSIIQGKQIGSYIC